MSSSPQRIGSSVANDLLEHTQATITITGRSPEINNFSPNERRHFLLLDLDDIDHLTKAISQSDLVIHCAGPFHYRNTKVLEICIHEGVNYIDVSDHRSYSQKALKLHPQAIDAGVTAIINAGIFPGISNSLVREGIEKFDLPEKIHLSYVVSGSGGAGITVMKTTFLGLQHLFTAWINNQWQTIEPYTERENIAFPPPYNNHGVYWFDVPETMTLPNSFPQVKTVITKFGSYPDFYNYLTWIAAHIFPKPLMQQPRMIEFLSHISLKMTEVTNIFTGIGVAIRAEITGKINDKTAVYCVNLVHENTTIATGLGVGTIAELLLNNQLKHPGVVPVEIVLPTHLFRQNMEQRNVKIDAHWLNKTR
ncbi:MAG: saccharopine dehydrogenase family protein [Cuspidothrix sp.]